MFAIGQGIFFCIPSFMVSFMSFFLKMPTLIRRAACSIPNVGAYSGTYSLLSPVCFFLFRNKTFNRNQGRDPYILRSHGSVPVLTNADNSGANRGTRPNERGGREVAGKTLCAQGPLPDTTVLQGFRDDWHDPYIVLSNDSEVDLCDRCVQNSHEYFPKTAPMNCTPSDRDVDNLDSRSSDSGSVSPVSGSSCSSEYVQPTDETEAESEEDCSLTRQPQVLPKKRKMKVGSRGGKQIAVQKSVSCDFPPL